MADKETGLFIPVSAYADKDSAKSAINELTKGVLSSLKDGYIEVPAEIKASYARGSKELDKAQKDVIKLYEKMSKEGFSSSVDDLDDLIEKYKKFKSLAGKEGKGNSKQTKWLTKTIGETLQPYLAQKRELDKIVASFEESVAKIEKSTKKSTKRTPGRKSKNYTLPSDEEIASDIKKHKDRQYKGVKSVGPKEPRGGWVDPGATNEYELKRSEQSPYKSSLARQMRQSERESYKKNKESLVVTKPSKEEFDKIWEESTSKGKKLRPDEKAKGLSTTLLDKTLPSLINKILAGDDVEAISKQFLDTAEAIYSLSETAGVEVYKTAKAEIGKTIGQFYNVKGRLGGTEGEDKTEGSRNADIEAVMKGLFAKVEKRMDKIIKQTIEIEQATEKSNKKSKSSAISNTFANKVVKELTTTNKTAEAGNTLAAKQERSLNTSYTQDIREATREGLADTAEGRTSKDELATAGEALQVAREDATSGFNEASASQSLISLTAQIQGAVTNIYSILQNIFSDGLNVKSEQPEVKDQSLLPVPGYRDEKTGEWVDTKVEDHTKRDSKVKRMIVTEEQEKKLYEEPEHKRKTRFNDPKAIEAVEIERAQIEAGKHESQQRRFLEQSEISTSQKGFIGALRKVFKELRPETEVEKIMNANAETQERMRAERIETFGLNRGRNLTDTGDIADVKRTKSLFGWNYKKDKDNKELFKDVRLTPGFTGKEAIDTTSIMKSLNKVLSGPEMFKAQTGGTFRNILGSMTGYIGMDSLEKSRAEAEGLNQVMANVRKEVLSLIQDVQAKEATLSGMEKMGTARFTKEGQITSDSSLAAKNTFEKLEEQKMVLKSALAEVGMIDQVVSKTGGKVSKIIKELGFVMPELMQNNTIIQNINAGLDKNGKALKFQTRTAETLNYTFQLMARHIGQMFKNWMMQLNPITQIKKAFQDFASYNPKWQRTMNVVKYNLRDVILPIMDKIAQLLVNMIGFADIILQKVQAAFGVTPISLFDQENAKKYKDEVEEIQNVTAGFDELHDIGSDSDKDPNNLLGDIYKPQLSQEWIDLAERIGDLFAGIITGDLGFSDVMKEILGIAWQGIKTLWNEIIKPFITNTLWPFIKENWLEILAWVAGAFLAWSFLKWAGNALWSAIFGKFTMSSITGVFGKVGGWITKAIGATSIGAGILQGLSNVLINGGGLVGTLKNAFTHSALITQMGGWGNMLGMVFIQSLGAVIGGLGVAKGFDMVADDASYNIGLEQAGGNEEDKKSGAGGKILGTVAGAVAGGFAIGGPIGAAVGALAGLLITSLAPAFEEVEVASRNANNEMQKIEYYQGQLQGAQTQVSEFDEMQRILNETLRLQTEKVYEEGEQLGITKTRMDELVTAVQNGTFHTGMLTGAEVGLKDSLIQLDAQQAKNKEATEKLEAAKRKLQKAEIDLAIAEDVAAGNFEMAAARVEYALAAELYETDEATKKMTQIIKEGSAEQAADILQDLSPDMRKNFDGYYSETESHLNELTDLYYQYNKDERECFLENLTPEVQKQMQERVDAIRREVENAPWYMRLMDVGNDGKILGMSYVDVPGYATGTNYVPSDGLAYLHKGEAVIPAKYNEGMGTQGKAYQQNTAASQELLHAITRLEATLNRGINVQGQFVQRGSDLVATVEKASNKLSNNILNNRVFAR